MPHLELCAVKLPIPIYKFNNSIFHGSIRFITDILHEIAGVSVGIGYIAGLQWQHVFFGLFAQAIFQYFDVTQQRAGIVVSDVVEAIGRLAGGGIRIITAPFRIRFGDLVQGTDHAFDDVVDIGEIPFVIAIVEDVDGFTGENVAGKHKQGHVRPAPGAIDREKAQAGSRQVK